MEAVLDSLLMFVFTLNIFMLGSSHLDRAIRTVAVQGVVLGLTPVFAHGSFSVEPVLLALATIALKGFAIPSMLRRSISAVHIRREVEPTVSFDVSMLLGGLVSGLALAFAGHLSLAPAEESSLIIPAAVSTFFTGFILLTTRKKAVTQVLGYLVLENGIFIFGLTLIEAVPTLVEAGVLLDLVVGIFVMGIMLNHIQAAFSSIDVDDLSGLKET